MLAQASERLLYIFCGNFYSTPASRRWNAWSKKRFSSSSSSYSGFCLKVYIKMWHQLIIDQCRDAHCRSWKISTDACGETNQSEFFSVLHLRAKRDLNKNGSHIVVHNWRRAGTQIIYNSSCFVKQPSFVYHCRLTGTQIKLNLSFYVKQHQFWLDTNDD